MTYTFAITKFNLQLTRTFVRNSLFILFFSITSTLTSPKAADTVPSENQNLDLPQTSILEGKSFSGDLGLVGKPASAKDLLLFNDGLFISKGCKERCGYTSAAYQVRAVEDYFEVISETPCLKSDATIIWRGKVKGNEIEGTFTWINKRWYWSFEKKYWFKGKLVESNAAKNRKVIKN